MITTVAQLRALADKLEAAAVDDTDCEIRWFNADTREQLAALVQLMDRPQPYSSRNGTCWVSGTICGIEATAFYPPGLLGKTKKTTVEVEVEESPDLKALVQHA